jgi:hypothetical protein
MRFTLLFLVVVATLMVLPQLASAQLEAPNYRPRYDDGYRGPPPPPPPPGYYDERRRDDRRYDDRRYDDRRYRERDGYREREVQRPRGGVFCAREGQFCQFQGSAVVRYGVRGRFVSRRAVNGIPCNNSVFGDPAHGEEKACFID